uniref:Uncharacterized protein n=1 Tax=Glycine max TaxID=3847 RepID=A0A0R0K6V9_SOYBN
MLDAWSLTHLRMFLGKQINHQNLTWNFKLFQRNVTMIITFIRRLAEGQLQPAQLAICRLV